MVRTIAICFGLLACAIAPTGAQDNTDSANFMLPYCKSFLAQDLSRSDLETNFYAGVCAGSIAAFNFVSRSLNKGFCFPEGATHGQMVRVVVAYIEARPARMHENFRDLALEALRKAWPCR
jgi:Ssp1 endopeptidase immunity protein Rap1a